jgi:hypothetical protein
MASTLKPALLVVVLASAALPAQAERPLDRAAERWVQDTHGGMRRQAVVTCIGDGEGDLLL